MSSKKSKKQRPVFYHLGDQNLELKAGGILFFQNKKLLMIKLTDTDKYDDFGGKTDVGDKSIYHTVAREVAEESNNILDYHFIKSQIINRKYIYIPKSKYALFWLELYGDYPEEDFGDFETREMVNRTVEWIPMEEFINLNKNFRLNNKQINAQIRALLEDRGLFPIYTHQIREIKLYLNEQFSSVPLKIAQHIWHRQYQLEATRDTNLNLVQLKSSSLAVWDNQKIHNKVSVLSQNQGTIYDSANGLKVVSLPLFKIWPYNDPKAEIKQLVWDNRLKIYPWYTGKLVQIYFYKEKWQFGTLEKPVLYKSDEDYKLLVKCLVQTLGSQKKANKWLSGKYLGKGYVYMLQMDVDAKVIHLSTRKMDNLKEVKYDVGLPWPQKMKLAKNMQTLKTYINNLHFTEGRGLVICDRNYHRFKMVAPSYQNEMLFRQTRNKRKYGLFIWKTDDQDRCLLHYPDMKPILVHIKKTIKKYFKIVNQLDDSLEPLCKNKLKFFQKLAKSKVNVHLKKFINDSYYKNYDITWTKFLEVVKNSSIWNDEILEKMVFENVEGGEKSTDCV